ncbi:hypothetical protein V8E55_010864 [Tylopilus felleus]|jgi:hypothetical protein
MAQSSPFMDFTSSYYGLEPVPPFARPVTSPNLAVRSSMSSAGLSPASIAIFLSLFGLAALACVFCWMRKRRTSSQTVSNERPFQNAVARDVEALVGTRPIIPVIPQKDVRWTPQIRAISGPALDKDSDRRIAALALKRARSPPPLLKPQTLVLDSFAKSAPAYAPSFPQDELSRPVKDSRGDLSPLVTPHALAVSGMQIRSLGRPGSGSEI